MLSFKVQLVAVHVAYLRPNSGSITEELCISLDVVGIYC